jgi:MraZ protein
MIQLLGEYVCKIDAKGRLMVPAGIKKQLPNIEGEGLIINRGFEKCLTIYPKQVWNGIATEVSKLNQFEEKTREFNRFFLRGVSELQLDASGRVLLPKTLLDWAKIESDVVLVCQFDKIELWSKTAYDHLLDSEPENFAKLAEEVMGNKNRRDDDGK